MLHYFKFRQDLFDPLPARDVYVKRGPGKGRETSFRRATREMVLERNRDLVEVTQQIWNLEGKPRRQQFKHI